MSTAVPEGGPGAGDDEGEFAWIARHFAPLAAAVPGAFGLTDDAARIDYPAGSELVVTTDALVSGVHFVGDEPAGLIARKALRTNLSDLAAMGARPVGYTVALILPRGTAGAWVADFAAGLAADQAEFGIGLLGGDTVATPGPLTVSITAMGAVPNGQMLRRSTAKPGDRVFVSGTIGDGALGLKAVRSELSGLAAADLAWLADRYHLPRPRLLVGQGLLGHASAALDISDGLVADLGHIAAASRVAIVITQDRVPLSPAAVSAVSQKPDMKNAILTGGDDYELAFTASPSECAIVAELASRIGVALTEIGHVETGTGVRVVDSQGADMASGAVGYRHF